MWSNSRIAVTVFAASLAASASRPAAVQVPARTEAAVTLETLAGKVEVRRAGEVGELRFARDGVVFVRYEGPRSAKPASAARVELLDGQRWSGDVAGGDGDSLRWKSAVGPELVLSIDHVKRLDFLDRVPALDRAGLQPAPEGDRLYWVHGDAFERVDGTFEAFSDEGVVLDGVLGKRTFPWSEVGALFVAPLDDAPPPAKPAGVALSLDLADGSRLRAGFRKSTPRGLLLAYPGLAELEIPYESLLEAALDDGSFAFLSDLSPSRAVEGSLFGDELGLRWPHRVDQAVVGGPLSVGGQVFSRGIGVHAPSRLEWNLTASAGGGAPARELFGSVGIDDSVRSTSARGSVRFQVLVDGEMRWDSGVVRGGERARPMPHIDLRGAKELALVVDPAEESFVADRADWLRLVLVRGP